MGMLKHNKLDDPFIVPEPENVITEDDIKNLNKEESDEKKIDYDNTKFVRVNLQTWIKLKVLMDLGKLQAKSFGVAIDMTVDDFIYNSLTKEEKNQFDVIYNLFKDKKKF